MKVIFLIVVSSLVLSASDNNITRCPDTSARITLGKFYDFGYNYYVNSKSKVYSDRYYILCK